MKIVIESDNMPLALKMVAQILDHPDGVYDFSGGYQIEVKTTKTQRTFKQIN